MLAVWEEMLDGEDGSDGAQREKEPEDGTHRHNIEGDPARTRDNDSSCSPLGSNIYSRQLRYDFMDTFFDSLTYFLAGDADSDLNAIPLVGLLS
jgi:hypothetical protein